MLLVKKRLVYSIIHLGVWKALEVRIDEIYFSLIVEILEKFLSTEDENLSS